MQQLWAKLRSSFTLPLSIQINYIFTMNCTAIPELPFMISVYYVMLNSRMWVAQATKTQPDNPSSDPNSLNTASLLSFCFFCLMTKKNYQSVKWPQISWKESVSTDRAQDRAESDSEPNETTEWTSNIGPPPNVPLRQQHHHWATRGSEVN